MGLVALGAVLAAAPAAAQPVDGRKVYDSHCAICHGAKGDGGGPGADRVAVKPRDFTTGRYKLRSTGSGQLPSDDDLRRSIRQGMPGTAMIPQDHLSDVEVEAVIGVVKGFSPRFARGPAPRPLTIPPAPAQTADTLARGRAVYVKGQCAECHGKEARGDGPSAKDLKIKPTDLTLRPFKSGPTPRDIFRAMLTGMDSTPMPSYQNVLEDDELWNLAHYVHALGGPPRVTDDERLGWEIERRTPRP